MFKPHYPPHFYIDQQIYFITARTVNRELFFDSQNKKLILYKAIKEAGEKFQSAFYARAIFANHYHLLFKITEGKYLPDFIQAINGKSAFKLNKVDGAQKRKIWFNYWDHCVRDEVDFWKHFNYIHHQPVKHGLCEDQAGAFQYPFSSAGQWIKNNGLEWVESTFELYPIVDFTVEGD